MPRCSKRSLRGAGGDLVPGNTSIEHHHHHKRTRNCSSRRHSKSEDTSFSTKKCISWFKEYTTAAEPDVLGPEGMEKFCSDLGVDPENVVMLVIAHKMQAKQMGYFTQEEWLKGLTEVQCDSVHKLQNKLDHLRNLLNDPHYFKTVYRYSYDFARPAATALRALHGSARDKYYLLGDYPSSDGPQHPLLNLFDFCQSHDKEQRSLDTSLARALLAVLLPKWPLRAALCTFLQTTKRYRVVNRDQWHNILEFSRCVDLRTDSYDADGAWPVMLDEFVEWTRAPAAAAAEPRAS